MVYSSNRPEVLFHTSGTHGIFPAEFSPQTQHRTFIRLDYPLCLVLFLLLLSPAWKQANSQIALARGLVRTNRHQMLRALICLRVRSHLALVLPSTSGRYSPGLYRDRKENHHPPWNTYNTLLLCKQISNAQQAHLNFWIGTTPKSNSISS